MSELYPNGPASVPDNLTKPTISYKRQAWLAVVGLLLFLVIYLGLASWFAWTAYRLMASAVEDGGNAFMGILTGLPAAFLAVFMFKALFFVKRGSESKDIELLESDEPKLFEFLYMLADEAGAPRPHKVYVSPRVNACVFYDLSILNFIFPSKKNLEIGLGLVNVLNLGELKAVLAHEFGHFAQRSMAIGSWVYIAHQVAAHIIVQRDILDRFLAGLSRFDIRVAWIGWVLRLIIWSIRSIMDTVFRIVVIAQRALSREMEFQADLVAVSLTGSDALVHALHKLNAADEAWERTMQFVSSEAGEGRRIDDLFLVQERIMTKLREILNDPHYGGVPPMPESDVENHRVFKTSVASPPKMWATHPESSAREENAKKQYVSSEIDDRSAWALFADKEDLQKRMLDYLLGASDLEAITERELSDSLNKAYGKTYYHKIFQGAYLSRSITRHTADVDGLFDEYMSDDAIKAALGDLYPNSLRDDLKLLNKLYDEKYSLEGILAGHLKVNGGTITHRGEEVSRQELPSLIEGLDAEIKDAERTLQEHDKACRTVHLSIAKKLGKGWEENLLGTIALLHYASHSAANVADMQGYLANVVAVVTADDRVTKKELQRVLTTANEAFSLLQEIYENADKVSLGTWVSKELEVDSWQEALGEFNLIPATQENINEWMQVIDGWLASTYHALNSLQNESLEQLLKLEAYVSKHYRGGSEVKQAPAAPGVDYDYSTLIEGSERERQKKLNLWERFYTADGFVPATCRLAVAASIVAGVIFLGQTTGTSEITIYNGLANTVKVDISGNEYTLRPYTSREIEAAAGEKQIVTTRINGKLVETFEVQATRGFGTYVYNVANADAMIEWTQAYGNATAGDDRYLGAPRWFSPGASILFREPPDSVQTKSGGATREVLEAYGQSKPGYVLDYVKKESEQMLMLKQHALWDAPGSRFHIHWLSAAVNAHGADPLLANRLANFPSDIAALRMQQDVTEDKAAYDEVCENHQTLSKASPDDTNLLYAVLRCMDDPEAQAKAFIENADQYPQHAWLNAAAAYSRVEEGNYQQANEYIDKAINAEAQVLELFGNTALRIKRLLGEPSSDEINKIVSGSTSASKSYRLDTGNGYEDSPFKFYSLLSQGQLEEIGGLVPDLQGDKPHATRLLGASDGATKAMIDAAFAAGDDDLDETNVLLMWALAKRTGRDANKYDILANDAFSSKDYVFKTLHAVEKTGAKTDIESMLYGLDIATRGYVYAAAAVLLGEKAPSAWKEYAYKALFAYERPYFKT